MAAKNKIKTYSLSEMKDEFIGKVGSPKRDEYEYELNMEVLSFMIKKARQERITLEDKNKQCLSN